MCAVSVVLDYWGTRPNTQWDRQSWDEFQEIIRRLDDLDAKLDQPECIDPAKAAWMKEVESRLDRLEKNAEVD